jgi:hypothetical protein|tara:strand:+ start:975 stop:1136 length:162 start_codon:yes stop_codon:yes gene_type:complete
LAQEIAIDNGADRNREDWNVRNENKHLQMVELGGEIIKIDKTLAEEENNKSAK